MGFQIFESLLHDNLPDLSSVGLIRNDVVQGFWTGRGPADYTLPPEATVTSVVSAASGSGPFWMDIEHWPNTPTDVADALANHGVTTTVAESIQKYQTMLQWFRAAKPGVDVGLYGTVPTGSWYGAIKDASVGGQTGYDAWRAINTALTDLALDVDILHPSLYTPFDEEDNWEEYAAAHISECRRLAPGKPVVPFIWPQYHESNQTLGYDLIDGVFWRKQLDKVYELADGVILWGGFEYINEVYTPLAWDANAEWWVATLEWLDAIKDIDQDVWLQLTNTAQAARAITEQGMTSLLNGGAVADKFDHGLAVKYHPSIGGTPYLQIRIGDYKKRNPIRLGLYEVALTAGELVAQTLPTGITSVSSPGPVWLGG
jgi:hypothetical protein